MGKLFLGVGIAFFTCQSSAYVYDIRILRRTVPGTQEIQFLVGLSDFHDKTRQQVITEQRSMLERLLKGAARERIRFFVEDLSSANCDGTHSCANYRVNTRGGFLGGITDVVRRYGYSVDNLEFRYCRVVALGLAAAGNNGPQARRLQEAIRLEQFIQETDKQLKIVTAYHDHALSSWYTSTMKAVEKEQIRLALHDNPRQTVREYLVNQKNNRPDEVLEQLLSYDSSLFDIRLVHELYNDVQHKTLVVAAGGTHIQEAFGILEKMGGYERVPIVQECLSSAGNTACNCLDVQHKTMPTCRFPQPVSLSCSKLFWPQRGH